MIYQPFSFPETTTLLILGTRLNIKFVRSILFMCLFLGFWFGGKKYGVPKDIVKLIANLLPNRYYRCPVWKFIKHCLDCPIPSINTHQGRAGHIYSYFHYAIPSRQKHFEFYAHVIGQQCHRPCKTFTMGDTGVAIEQENVVFYFYFHDMDIGGVVTIDENFLQSNGFL